MNLSLYSMLGGVLSVILGAFLADIAPRLGLTSAALAFFGGIFFALGFFTL